MISRRAVLPLVTRDLPAVALTEVLVVLAVLAVIKVVLVVTVALAALVAPVVPEGLTAVVLMEALEVMVAPMEVALEVPTVTAALVAR
jgi:hypothetical protein